jgi:hypothetical protein
VVGRREEEEEEACLLLSPFVLQFHAERKPAVPMNKDRETNSRSRMSSGQSKENRPGSLSKSKSH